MKQNVLNDATKMAKFLKLRLVHSRMFLKLYENLDKEHKYLLTNRNPIA